MLKMLTREYGRQPTVGQRQKRALPVGISRSLTKSEEALFEHGSVST